MEHMLLVRTVWPQLVTTCHRLNALCASHGAQPQFQPVTFCNSDSRLSREQRQ
jgi:hypothetical protein